MRHIVSLFIGSVLAVAGVLVAGIPPVYAQAQGQDFSVQVSPSPLVATVKPGQKTDLELKVRNNSLAVLDLKIEARSFSVDDATGEVKVNDTAPSEVNEWIRFSNPSFTVQPGQWFTQTVSLNLPQSTGFSYYFGLVINQKNTPIATEGGRLLKGSVVVFTLINVDRPGATRKLDIVELESSRQVYEYLPAELKVRFKNSGNSIVQPYGNIFIQRGADDTNPIATLAVNETKGYILPGSSRTLETKWEGGFPETKTNADGTTSENWDWSKIADFRFGQYTAKLVGVYNDGERDVPLEAAVTFWVIPWRAILILIISIVLIWFLARKLAQRRTAKAVKKALAAQASAQQSTKKDNS